VESSNKNLIARKGDQCRGSYRLSEMTDDKRLLLKLYIHGLVAMILRV